MSSDAAIARFVQLGSSALPSLQVSRTSRAVKVASVLRARVPAAHSNVQLVRSATAPVPQINLIASRALEDHIARRKAYLCPQVSAKLVGIVLEGPPQIHLPQTRLMVVSARPVISVHKALLIPFLAHPEAFATPPVSYLLLVSAVQASSAEALPLLLVQQTERQGTCALLAISVLKAHQLRLLVRKALSRTPLVEQASFTAVTVQQAASVAQQAWPSQRVCAVLDTTVSWAVRQLNQTMHPAQLAISAQWAVQNRYAVHLALIKTWLGSQPATTVRLGSIATALSSQLCSSAISSVRRGTFAQRGHNLQENTLVLQAHSATQQG